MKLWKNVLPKNTNQASEKRNNHNLLRLPSKLSNTSKQLNTLYTPQHTKQHQQELMRGYSEEYKSDHKIMSKTNKVPLSEHAGQFYDSFHTSDRNSQNKDSEVEVVQFDNSNIFDIKKQLMSAFEDSFCDSPNEKLVKMQQLKNQVNTLNTLTKQTKNQILNFMQQFQQTLHTLEKSSSGFLSSHHSKLSNIQQKYLSQLETKNKKLIEELSSYQNVNSDLKDRLYRQSLKLTLLEEEQKQSKSKIDELKEKNIRLEEEMFEHRQKAAQIQLEISNRVQKLMSVEGSGEPLWYLKQMYQDEIKMLTEQVQSLRKMVEACTNPENSNIEKREKILIQKEKILESNYAQFEKMLIETDQRVQQVSFKQQHLAQEYKNLHNLKLQLQSRQQQISAVQSQILRSKTSPKNYDIKLQSDRNSAIKSKTIQIFKNKHQRNKSLIIYHDQVDDKKRLNFNPYISSIGLPSTALLRSNSSSNIRTSLFNSEKKLPQSKKWDGYLGELSNKIERLKCEIKQEIRAAR